MRGAAQFNEVETEGQRFLDPRNLEKDGHISRSLEIDGPFNGKILLSWMIYGVPV